VEYPTTLDILVARLSAIEARLAQLEGHAVVAVTVGSRDLEAALAKLGDAIARRDRGGLANRRCSPSDQDRKTVKAMTGLPTASNEHCPGFRPIRSAPATTRENHPDCVPSRNRRSEQCDPRNRSYRPTTPGRVRSVYLAWPTPSERHRTRTSIGHEQADRYEALVVQAWLRRGSNCPIGAAFSPAMSGESVVFTIPFLITKELFPHPYLTPAANRRMLIYNPGVPHQRG
jgi:hypothetical protein